MKNDKVNPYVYLLVLIIITTLGIYVIAGYALKINLSEQYAYWIAGFILVIMAEEAYLCFSTAEIIRKNYKSGWKFLGSVLFLAISQSLIFYGLYITNGLDSDNLFFLFITLSVIPAIIHYFLGDKILKKIGISVKLDSYLKK